MKSIKLPTLYKRSNSKNNINQWDITIDGDSYYSTSGYVGMKQFQNEPTRCVGKNIGKKNETTPEQQATFEATQMWQKRKDLGYHENIDDCDVKTFYAPMLATEFNKVKGKIKFRIMSQPKLDGMRCILKSDGMWTRTGKEIISAPHIFESIQHLFDKYPDLILDGELYTSNKDVDFNTIISCVRKTKPTQQDLEVSRQYIDYWIYDIPNLDNKEYSFTDRTYQLIDVLNPPIKYTKIVDTYILGSYEEIQTKFLEYVGNGFEGQILRDPNSLYENKRSKGLIKHKEFIDEEFIILRINEGIGKFANKAATITFKSDEGVECSATINGTMDYLEEIWGIKDTLIGKECTVKHFGKTPDFSYRFPKVIQINRNSYE